MRRVRINKIVDVVRKLCKQACFSLNLDMMMCLENARKEETSALGKEILTQLMENAELAEDLKIPICQDTGMVSVFVELGQDVHLVEGDIEEAINEGVRQGYDEGLLRKSVCHPISRENTGDNTPAIIHYDIVPGEKIKIIVMPKGAGSENVCRATVLTPADGIEGVENFVRTSVKSTAERAKTCGPLIVGVGIGGSLDKAASLAKKALLRPLDLEKSESECADLEEKWLRMINNFGYGPLGLGGRVTCITVNIELFPCHIASIPVAVNIQCHVHRWKEAII